MPPPDGTTGWTYKAQTQEFSANLVGNDSNGTPFSSCWAPRLPQKAFTLAECLIASVVLSVSVIGVAATLSASHAQTSNVANESQAVTICGSSWRKSQPSRSLRRTRRRAGRLESDRSKYDSVMDYSGYSDESPFPTLEGDSATVSSKVPFSRQVTIAEPATLFGAAVTPGDAVMVTVDAQDTLGRGATLHRLVTPITTVR